jgi:hypothetical protein
MTSKKVNIKAGDIGETDEENEKLIAQLAKKPARAKVVRKTAKGVVVDVPDQVVSYEEKPAAKPAIKKQAKPQAAQKPAAKEKTVKPHAAEAFVNARGVTMKATGEWKPATKLTRENAIKLVSMKEQGTFTLGEMADAIGTSTGYIGWVLYKNWRRDLTQDLFPDFATPKEAQAYWKQRQAAYKLAHAPETVVSVEHTVDGEEKKASTKQARSKQH